MSLSDIKDQSVPVRLLRNIITNNRVPNGLLFWGPEGVGKRFAAMEFAKSLNCTGSVGDACNVCLACRKVNNGNHPDVKIISPKSKTLLILNESVEMMNDLAAYRPFEAKYRVIIIEDADRMQVGGQNHFLKTLEEPPSPTVFILLSSSPRRLLPTIRSRCQQVRFGALRPETVTELLVLHRGLSPEIAEPIAAVSQGQMSRAFDLVDTNRRTVVIDLLRRLGNNEDAVVLAEEFAKSLKEETEAIKRRINSGEDSEQEYLSKEELEEAKAAQDALISALTRRATMEYLYLMETWYRDALVTHSAPESGTILNMDMVQELKASPCSDVEAKFKAIEKAWLYIERNLNSDRVFRDLFCALSV